MEEGWDMMEDGWETREDGRNLWWVKKKNFVINVAHLSTLQIKLVRLWREICCMLRRKKKEHKGV